VRRLVVLLVVLGGLGLAVDFGAQAWAEGQIETRARAELPSQVSVSADISAFPFLPPLLLGGRVAEVAGHFKNVEAGVLTLSAVDIELRGVRINRSKLLNDRKVELTRIREGTVSVEIESAVLAKALGVPLTIANGQVRLAGALSGVASVSVRANAVVFNVAGVTRSVPIPKTRLVPCASTVTVLAGRLRLSCTIHDVPPALLGAANRGLSGA
jgi:hypothetical protein